MDGTPFERIREGAPGQHSHRAATPTFSGGVTVRNRIREQRVKGKRLSLWLPEW
jgi:hypothetical protein